MLVERWLMVRLEVLVARKVSLRETSAVEVNEYRVKDKVVRWILNQVFDDL